MNTEQTSKNIFSYNSILTSIQRVYHGSESLSYLGLKIWKSIPTESKQKSFKESIKL